MKHENAPESLAQWFETPQGRQFMVSELALIEKSVARLFGTHCGVSSLYRSPELMQQIPCRRVYELVSPSIQHRAEHVSSAKQLISPICRLPFADESLDCFIMLHTLDFAARPHDAIREVARVIRPGGQMILVGFNPASMLGWSRYVPGLRQQLPDNARFLGRQRVCDWLELLHFDLEYIGGASLLPLRKENKDGQEQPASTSVLKQSSVWKAARAGLGKAFRERYGGVYCVRVRKVQMAGTLVGPVKATRPVWAPLSGSGVVASQVKPSSVDPKASS